MDSTALAQQMRTEAVRIKNEANDRAGRLIRAASILDGRTKVPGTRANGAPKARPKRARRSS